MAEQGLQGRDPQAVDSAVDLDRLRAARDVALQAAREAVRDTTRLTRLLTILGEPGPLEALLDRALATLSELFAADIVILVDARGTGNLAPRAAIGLPEDLLQKPLASWDEGYVAEVMRSTSPAASRDIATWCSPARATARSSRAVCRSCSRIFWICPSRRH